MEQSTVTAMTAGRNSPSGMRTGYVDQGSFPIQAAVGSPNQGGRQTYIGTDQNNPPGPPIWSWNRYDFMYNAYYGSGGFYDGTALVKSVVESEDQYFERRRVSYYENFVKPIIDATYLPVFSAPIMRETIVGETPDKDGTLAPLWDAMLKDVDRKKTHIGVFVHKAIKYARVLGVSYIVMDNFPEVSELQKDAVENREFPYVALRLPQQVEPKFTVLDELDNILEIVFIEKSEIVNGKPEDRWKKWTTEYSVKLEKDKNGNFVEVSGTFHEHNLGVCPVIPVISKDSEDGTILPMPVFYAIARCNWALYNICSSQMRLLRSQMFAILCLPKMEGAFSALATKGFELPANNTQTGESYPLPFYLAPPVGPYQEITETITHIREELYRLAGQEGVSGVRETKSGIAKAFDFSAEGWVLKETALMAERVECKIAELFKLYTSLEFDYEATYTQEYKPTYADDRMTRDTAIVKTVSTVSTPYNPIISALLKDLLELFYQGTEEDKKEIIEWITANTSKSDTSQTEGKGPPPPEDLQKEGAVQELLKSVFSKFQPKEETKSGQSSVPGKEGAANELK
jgi:hypothetical protein